MPFCQEAGWPESGDGTRGVTDWGDDHVGRRPGEVLHFVPVGLDDDCVASQDQAGFTPVGGAQRGDVEHAVVWRAPDDGPFSAVGGDERSSTLDFVPVAGIDIDGVVH